MWYVLCLVVLVISTKAMDETVVQKTKRAMQILDRIAIAANTHNVKPAILVDETENVGFYEFKKRRIVLDSGLFAIADSFGNKADDVLAYIIGHEFAHFVRGHAFDHKFIHQFGSFASIKPVNTAEGQLLIDKQAESEADYFGLYYALLAGYNLTVRDVERYWKLIVQRDGVYIDSIDTSPINVQDPHQTSSERVENANRVLLEMRELTMLHEVANVALMTGEYLQASVLYEYICQNVNIPSVNWNELLARYLYLQELSRRWLVDDKVVRQQHASEFAYRSRDQMIKLDREQMIYRCRSLIGVLRAARYNDFGVSQMENLIALFEEAKECSACSSVSPCPLHKARAKEIEDDISQRNRLAGGTLTGNTIKINPLSMVAVSTELDKKRSVLTPTDVPLSAGKASIYFVESNGKTLLRYSYTAPRARATYRIDMSISHCPSCEATGLAQQDNIVQQSFSGKLVESAFFAE